jgi:phosphoribosylaminoimidazolecarboxamide formyltransferase/IMP cyclohydrolase
MLKVQRALISVSDKKGLLPFARGLAELGVEILSTGGTASLLRDNGIEVIDVADYTGFPEMLDGRLKTLHPKVHGGILAMRDKETHMDQVKEHKIGLIDMVVVNLYPFKATISKKNVPLEDAIENIDIGGPTMLRSAAKNYKGVAVLSNPDRYEEVLHELKQNSGLLSDTVLFKLSVEAFTHTAEYDTMIAEFLNKRVKGDDDLNGLPKEIGFGFEKVQDLRYGENPHQTAAFYRAKGEDFGFSKLKQLHGKELSFNNIYDLNAALEFVKDFKDPAAVVIKHNNPTGVAQNKDLAIAFKQAHQCDPISAFGGIIGLNKNVDEKTAKLIVKSGFMECVLAPGYDKEALVVLKTKKNLRLVEMSFKKLPTGGYDSKKVTGGLLLQDVDNRTLSTSELKVVTRKKPTKAQIEAMLFGWQMIKNVKSNAIVLVKGKRAVGIGCGQTSRVEAAKIAIEKAGSDAQGSVLISDAFIPHIDNVQLAHKAGIKAIIQTGGSVADERVIEEADKHGIAMVMSGVRHFKH